MGTRRQKVESKRGKKGRASKNKKRGKKFVSVFLGPHGAPMPKGG